MPDAKHVRGLSDLQKFMDTFAPRVEANIMRGALRAGCTQELLPEIQANIVAAGAIKTGEYIAGLKVGTRVRGGTVTGYVRASGKHGHLGPWLEYGVAAHTITAKSGLLFFGGIFAKSVDHPGIQPRPHFRPALDRAGIPAVVAAAEYMKKRITKEGGLNAQYVKVEGDE